MEMVYAFKIGEILFFVEASDAFEASCVAIHLCDFHRPYMFKDMISKEAAIASGYPIYSGEDVVL